ncbi:MAG: DUF2500 domain-containing protein [Clostridiaceae bacterium]|nr:DUF2500 domain-containing protein [Clostridiaceae bacterium]
MRFGNPFSDFMFSTVPFFIFIVFAIIVMVFVTSFVKGIGQYFRNNSIPEKNIPAKLVAKRTHTWGGHGGTNVHTSYYATFETENGDRLEFSVSSQFYGMHIEGDAGILTHKDIRFIDFEREGF